MLGALGLVHSDKQRRVNNSMVVFAPNDRTMHGVKADYDHLSFQRTQLYGNLWYSNCEVGELKPRWEDLRVTPSPAETPRASLSPRALMHRMLPERAIEAIRSATGRAGDRLERNI